MFLVACGGHKASRDDVYSALKKSISLASEAEAFINYLAQGRSTLNFANGYLRYLRTEVNRDSQELSALNADPPLKSVISEDRVQLESLQAEIATIQPDPKQTTTLSPSAKRIRQIRVNLERLSSSL